ncbi:hypothetical protein B9Z55_005137 [Caenorhabditis nigoni]|uniref:EF-hand domain-containing protein n=1 Tax=Caenorhabditis nigoni TaxID=1611254 RepID=A0A2G5UZX5_9PELO|nr:hypothetical protein B9Z55_005137 [Caenorhabditis nigoni]
MIKPILAIFLFQTVFSIPLNRSDILDNDHVQLMPLERDGEINEKFRQEMLFSHNLDTTDTKQLADSIKEMFKITDKNEDGYLTAEELKSQIRKNMEEHLERSKNDSEKFFEIIDLNKDGWVTWEEFEPHFDNMHRSDHDENELLQDHTEGLNSRIFKKKIKKCRVRKHPDAQKHNFSDPHRVEDEKRMFNRSDITKDGRLDKMEWHIFLHPEYSSQGLVEIVNDLIDVYDKNNDREISQEEFVNGVPGSIDETNPEFEKMEEEETKRRIAEFTTEIDQDSNGKASFRELYEYVDPQNFRLASKEIMMLTDTNNDGKVSLEELLERDWLLARSSLLSARNGLHDEM